MGHHPTTVRAYGILTEHERVLLVRASSPRLDPPLWWLPGGGLEFGESPRDALVREFAEETGFVVAPSELVDVVSDVRRRPNGDRIHSVRVIYRVARLGGQLRDELNGTTDRARWFDLAGLGDVNLAPYTRDALSLTLSK